MSAYAAILTRMMLVFLTNHNFEGIYIVLNKLKPASHYVNKIKIILSENFAKGIPDFKFVINLINTGLSENPFASLFE